MGRIQFNCNDGFIYATLLYCSVLVVTRWSSYAGCAELGAPLHVYYLLDFIILMMLRGTRFAQQYWLTDRMKLKRVFQAKVVIFVLFFFWTVMGTVWFDKSQLGTDNCLPEAKNQEWTFGLWLSVCYFMIAVLAFRLVSENRRGPGRHGHRNLRAARGRDQRPANIRHLHPRGLHEDIISSIPVFVQTGPKPDPPMPGSPKDDTTKDDKTDDDDPQMCIICLGDILGGDECKKMPHCGHVFHSTCIDSWLLRKGECPICRADIIKGLDTSYPPPEPAASPSPSAAQSTDVLLTVDPVPIQPSPNPAGGS